MPALTVPLVPPGRLAAIVVRLRTAGCVFAEDEADLLVAAAGSPAELEVMVRRRVIGLPLEQVVGWAEFCGLRIVVEPTVFVPRHRSELLVRQARALARSGDVVVDLCCGTGAVGAAVAATVTGIELWSADVDPAAVRCARRNLDPARVFEGDLYEALPATLRGRVDLLIANAPYVPTAEIGYLPAEAREYESHVTLDGGADGLDVQRRIAAQAAEWLVPRGFLLVETSDRQAEASCSAFALGGLTPQVVTDDELGATVVIGTPAVSPGRR